MKTYAICAIALSLSLAHSQQPAPVAEGAPLKLPADNVELVDATGRKTMATVLEKHSRGITILNLNGGKTFIPWDKLNTLTQQKFITSRHAEKIDPTVETPNMTPQEEAIKFYITWMEQGPLPGEKTTDFRHRIGKAAHPARDALKGKNAKELQEGYLNRNPIVMAATLPTKFEWARNETALLAGKDPDYGRIGFSTRINNEYIRKLEIKDPQEDERVSLRENLLKIGVKPTQQIGPTCSFYSLFHMLQFACLIDGKKYPSIEAIRAAVVKRRPSIGNPSNPNPNLVFPILADVCGERPMVMDLRTGIPKLTEEVVKQELRNGRPCCVQTTYRKQGVGHHAIVVVGFETKGGVTRYEYLDSNKIPTENGSGFNTFPNEFITPINWDSPLGTYSLWFK